MSREAFGEIDWPAGTDDGRGYVPPLLMAARKVGLELRPVWRPTPTSAALLYNAGKLTDPGLVQVRVGPCGYTVRRKSGARWRTICTDVKRTDTAMRHILRYASRYCVCGGFFQEGAFVHADGCER